MIAKISSYVPSGSGMWPRIRLYDPTDGQVGWSWVGSFLLFRGKKKRGPARVDLQPGLSFQNVDVGEELIRLGFAVQTSQDGDGASRPFNEGEPLSKAQVSNRAEGPAFLVILAGGGYAASPRAKLRALLRKNGQGFLRGKITLSWL